MSVPPIVQDRNQLAVFGSQLLGVLIVIATLLTQQGELHSWRPTGTKNQAPAQDDQNGNKFARLWEDPLEDIPTFPVGAASPSPTALLQTGGPSLSSSSTSSPGFGTTPQSPTVTAAQHQEMPSRSPSPTSRPGVTAVQNQAMPAPLPASGLAPVKYRFLWNIVDARPLPEITERRLRTRYALVSAILTEGYLPLRESVLSPLFEAGSEKRNLIGRFETFRKLESEGGQTWRYVSVIWTPKQSTKLPIAKEEVEPIKEQIWQRDIAGVSHSSSEEDIWFLHHGNSDDLSNLSAASASPPPNTGFLRATVPLKCLANPPPKGWESLQKITTDDNLVKALVRELSLRIPALNDRSKAPRVVVFTESDTTYSRAITRQLANKLKKKNVTLEIYSYLRALDGRPDEARLPETGESSKSEGPTASLLQRRAISETSFGTSQFDYLRRTALDLKAKRNRPREKVVAVGILGSDIYDKMLVLQAVRPALPAAVFFTTDLDALYLERAMQPFTRNLVVASADDLEINEGDNSTADGWKLPPMRDSYQTVLVKEVRNILRPQGAAKQSGSPRIFEIGAGKGVELTGTGGGSWLLWCLAQWWFNLLIFPPTLGNAFLILWAVTTRDSENSPPGAMKKWAHRLVYTETILAGLGLLFILSKLTIGKSAFLFGEPLGLGISIWPSVMIRLLAFGVAVVLLSLASYSFVVYGLAQKDDLEKALAGRIQFPYRANKDGELVSNSFEHFFHELFDRSALRWRIVKLSIAYLVFSFVLFAYWQPTVPGRSGSTLLIEKIVLALGVALYIIHLMFCLDLHFCALRLLRAIDSHFHSEHEQRGGDSINLTQMLTSLSRLTMVIGKTLLYPLTVLILIILSRLKIFDNWVITPSLTITFALGAIVLVAASLILWLEGARLKRVVLAQTSLGPTQRGSLQKTVNDGVFATWYNQPIFSAILSALAVFGSLSIARPLTRLFFDSF
jgi:hypothetical protein